MLMTPNQTSPHDHPDGEALITSLVDLNLRGESWGSIEASLAHAVEAGTIDARTAEWAHSRLPTMVAQADRRRTEAWARIVVWLHAERRFGGPRLRFNRERNGRSARLAYARLVLGQVLVDAGRPLEAIVELKAAADLLQKDGPLLDRALAAYFMARCASSRALWAEAEDAAGTAAELFAAAGDSAQAGEAYIMCAQAATRRGDVATAADAIRAARECIVQSEGRGKARVLIELADHLRGVGDLEEARHRAEEAVAAALASGSAAELAAAEDVRARVLWRGGRPDEAMTLLIEVARRYRSSGFERQALETELSAVEAAAESGHLAEGEALLRRVEEKTAGEGHAVLTARTAFARGKLLLLSGDQAGAGAAYQQGLSVLQTVGIDPAVAGLTVKPRADAASGQA